MIQATPHAEEVRSRIDAVIFDMDGVLLDITDSIRVVNILAVPFYLREVLGWPAPDTMLTSADIEMFKNAGGFNDDIDLSQALILHYLVKGREHPDDSPVTLNVLPPTLRRYTALIKEHGGGLRAAETICFEGLSRQDQDAIESHYHKARIRQIFQEMFGGEHCERIYGFTPSLYHGPGWINKDRVLLEVNKVPTGKMIGMQTGRTRPEAMFGMELLGLTAIVPASSIITRDDGHKKPDPGGLAELVRRLGFTRAVYVGDTLDDLRTVRNFNAQSHEAKFLAAQVLTGPAGAASEPLFRNGGADIIATDVNAVLDWLAG